jgi:hypothetical protein
MRIRIAVDLNTPTVGVLTIAGLLLLTVPPSAHGAERLSIVTTPDIQRYCRREDKEAQLAKNNAYGWICMSGSASSPINMSQLCRHLTGRSRVIERLANMHDVHSGWECWSWDNGRIYSRIQESTFANFCRLLGYNGVSLVEKSAYGWRCTSRTRADASFSVTQVCHVLLQKIDVIDRIAEYDDPLSWECWN